MKFIKITLLIFFFYGSNNALAQRANNWYFGVNAGLNFSTTPASTLSAGLTNSPDNTSTISDMNGNLLFYTNGINVWNSQHSVMPNGSGLTGNTSAGQCALIVPIPCDPNKYVIFHVTEFSNPGYLHYTVVNMSLNGGLGDVVTSQKNVSLGSGWTEKLCAYYNSVGNNYWLVSHKWNSNQFVAFEINSSSIATNSVVSSIGSVHNCGSFGSAHDAMGQLTISPDGTKILNALTCADKFEIFDFNSVTGVISNSVAIAGTGGNAWGTAFSPDSKKIYTNTIFGTTVFQYDINTFSQSAIAASLYSVITVGSSGYNFGYMELGPDNKLYIAKPSSNSISVVNNPNSAGAACNFSIAGQSLGNKSSNHGLSRIAYNIPPGIGSFSIGAIPSSTLTCPINSITLVASPSLSPSSYTWAGPGILTSVNNQSIQVNSPGVYTCTIPTCTNVLTSVTFTVYSSIIIPTLTLAPSNPSVCAGSALTLSVTGATSYTWQPGNLTGSLVTISPSTSIVYTVSGTNSSSCISTSVQSISVVQIPTLIISPSNTSACSGTSFTFTQSGASSYTWQPNNLQTIASSVIITPSVSSIYTISGINSGGCSSTVSIQITIYPTPSLVINPVSSTVCGGAMVSYSALGANNYTWLPGGTNGSVAVLTIPGANTSYTLIGSSIQGCTAEIVKSLTVIPSPTLTVSTNPTTTCAGGTVVLTGGGASTYTWNPGNLTGSTVVVNPLTTTIYTLTGSANACSSTSSVMVANPLSPTITSTGDITCSNNTSQITIAANSSSYSLIWSGPGLIGQPSASVITVANAGIYTVVLTDTLTNCSATETMAINSTVGALSTNIIPSNTLSCYPGPAVNLLISASANYSWFPAAQVSPANGPLVSVNPSVTTTYTVYATLGVCSGSSAITISVNPTPSVEPSVYSQTICSGITTSLFATGATNYNWNPGNINLPSPVVSPPSTTVYTVTGTSNSCSAVNTLTVVVLPSPFLFATIYPNTICIGNSAKLSANGAESVLWTSPNFTSNLSTVSVNPFASTVYTATGTNSLGCSSTATLALTVNSGPSLIPFVSDSLICSGETVTLSASGASSYTWFPGNQTGANIVVSPSVTTNYTVMSSALGCNSYTTSRVVILNCVKALFGVTNAADKPVFTKGMYYLIHFTVTAVNSSQQDLTNVKLTNSLPETFPQPSTFTVVNAPKVSSQGSQLKANPFYNGSSELSLTISDSSTLLASKRDTIVFSVLLDPRGISGSFKNWVIGFADLFSTQTLSDTSNTGFSWDPDQDGNPTNNNQATLLTIELIELFIPEGFSPNADGNNDLFEIKGLNGRKVNLTLFNRWGNKVYEQANYENNWGGEVNVNSVQFGSGKLPEGTYYYVLEFQDGKTEPINGFVVLRY